MRHSLFALAALAALLSAAPAWAAAPPPDVARILAKEAADEPLTEAEQARLDAWQEAQDDEEERAGQELVRGLLGGTGMESVVPSEVVKERPFECPKRLAALGHGVPSPATWTALLERVLRDASARVGEEGPRLAKAAAAARPREARAAGVVLGALQSASGGVVILASACRREPASLHCAANLGSLLDALDDDQGAATALAWAESKGPRHPLPQVNLGWLYYHRGDLANARLRFQRVEAALGPSRITDLGLGLVALCSGDKAGARARLARVEPPGAAGPALQAAHEDQRTVQRRQRGEEDGDEDGDDGEADEGEPDPAQPPPLPLDVGRAQRPDLPHPPIAGDIKRAAESAKFKLTEMKSWGEDMRRLDEKGAGLRAAVAAEAAGAGLSVQGNRVIWVADDEAADEAWDRVRDHYRARFHQLVKARRAALQPLRDASEAQADQLRRAFGACLLGGSKECAAGVCERGRALSQSTLQQLTSAWTPHHERMHTLIGDFGQVSAQAVSQARGPARHAALDVRREWQVMNWLQEDWSSAVEVETSSYLPVEFCPLERQPVPPERKKVRQVPAKPGCRRGAGDHPVGFELGVVSGKASCGKMEVAFNFEGFTGSIGHDATSQTTTMFLGIGSSGALSGNAGMYMESTGGHISDFGVRATAGLSGDVGVGGVGAKGGAETTLGFGMGKAIDGYLAASEGGASTGGALEAALVSGSTFQSTGTISDTAGPLSLGGPPVWQ